MISSSSEQTDPDILRKFCLQIEIWSTKAQYGWRKTNPVPSRLIQISWEILFTNWNLIYQSTVRLKKLIQTDPDVLGNLENELSDWNLIYQGTVRLKKTNPEPTRLIQMSWESFVYKLKFDLPTHKITNPLPTRLIQISWEIWKINYPVEIWSDKAQPLRTAEKKNY